MSRRISPSFIQQAMPAMLALAGLMSSLMPAQVAQAAPTLAPFTRYVVTARIPGNTGSTINEPRVINDAGEVGGALVKSAGKVWKWLPASGDFWDGTFGLFPRLVSTTYVNAFPAIWTGATARELPQFGGNHSSWIRSHSGDGQWLVVVSAEPGRFPMLVGDRSVRVPIKQPRFLTSQGQYSAVIGPGTDDAESFQVQRNGAGALVYQHASYEAKDRLTHLVVNGQDRTLLPPGATINTRFSGLSDEGGVLLSDWSAERGAPGEMVINCHVYRQGQYLPVNVTVAETVVETDCSSLGRDGTVYGAVTVLNPASTTVDRTALYAWKDGQTTLMTDFVPDYFRRIPAVDAFGWTDVGIVGRKDVSKHGIYRNGVFTDALASAGIVVKSGEYAGILSYNKAGQLLVSVQNDSANSKYYVVLSPR